LSITRLAISIVGVFLLTQNRSSNIDLTGVLLMLLAAFLYALHIPINQRVLYEVPAPTVTFYTLLSMTAVVLMVKLILTGTSFRIPAPALQPILWLTLVTFGSRLALFAGVKAIGGVQTALIGLLELLVTVLLAIIFLGESFGLRQWIGATLLIATLILSAFEKDLKTSHITRGWLFWLRPSKPITLPEPEISEDTKISPEG
jgi:drug/metabolite transporter (DMT)-like permease